MDCRIWKHLYLLVNLMYETAKGCSSAAVITCGSLAPGGSREGPIMMRL